jgi:hypothetical protein
MHLWNDDILSGVWQTQSVQGGTPGARLVTVPVSTVRPTASSLVAAGGGNIRIARRPSTPGTTTLLMPIQRQQGSPGMMTMSGQISSQSVSQQGTQQQIVVTSVESLTAATNNSSSASGQVDPNTPTQQN